MTVNTNDVIVDLGTGCGVMPLILFYRHREKIRQIIGIEIQPQLAALARDNLNQNNFGESGKILEGDIRNILELLGPECCDSVVMNPPFYSPRMGRLSASSEAAIARHQLNGTLDDFCRSAAAVVKNKGGVYIVYPAEKITDIIHYASRYRLEARRFRFVYSYPVVLETEETALSARLVLVECRKNGGRGAKVLPPLFIYSSKNGPYSLEIQRYFKKYLQRENDLKAT
jgi:tRNA1Val (adenine37-N6)-methyltransferase